MKSFKVKSGHLIIAGALLLGGSILYKGFFSGSSQGREVPEGEGSFGGSEYPDDLLGHQGFDIDPNVVPEQPGGSSDYNTTSPEDVYDEAVGFQQTLPQEEALPTIVDNPTNEAQAKVDADRTASFTDKTLIYDPSGDIIGYHDVAAQQSVFLKSAQNPDNNSTGLLGTGVTAGQFALGSVGMAGSYFSSFGESVIKRAPDGTPLLKQTYKSAIEDIPIFGKKAASFVGSESLEVGGKTIAKDVTEAAVESGSKSAIKLAGGQIAEAGAKEVGFSALKSVGKKGAKIGISTIPLIGTAAGAEFDVRVSGKSRLQAYTANIVGDVIGGGVGALLAPFGGAPGIVGGIGGQIAGEQAVYGLFNFFTGNKEEGSTRPKNLMSLSDYSGVGSNPFANIDTFSQPGATPTAATMAEQVKTQQVQTLANKPKGVTEEIAPRKDVILTAESGSVGSQIDQYGMAVTQGAVKVIDPNYREDSKYSPGKKIVAEVLPTQGEAERATMRAAQKEVAAAKASGKSVDQATKKAAQGIYTKYVPTSGSKTAAASPPVSTKPKTTSSTYTSKTKSTAKVGSTRKTKSGIKITKKF